MLTKGIDALSLDPLAKFHTVNEMDNGDMEIVGAAFTRLAERTNAAIEALHHIRKQPPGTTTGPATVDDIRGASALIGVARMARVVNSM